MTRAASYARAVTGQSTRNTHSMNAQNGSMPDNNKTSTRLIYLLMGLVLVFVVAQFFNYYCLRIHLIPGNAMSNTLFDGDYVLVDLLAYSKAGSEQKAGAGQAEHPEEGQRSGPESAQESGQNIEQAPSPKTSLLQRLVSKLAKGQPQYGDLVAFNLNERAAAGSSEAGLIVQRLIGMPGDNISIRNKEIYRNGQKLEEPYVRHSAPEEMLPLRDELDEINVPEGTYFMMADNRDVGKDSRIFGPIAAASIQGKAIRVLFSRNNSVGSWRSERIWLPLQSQ